MSELLEFGGYLTIPSIFLWLMGYWIIERIVKNIFQHFFATKFDSLYRERKDTQYFTFIMGMIITAVSTPICYTAFSDSNDSNDNLGIPNLSRAGQICIATRSVLWASELNRLDHSTGYIKHHLGSLGYLVYQLQAKLPMRFIYAIYTSLLTELFSDLVCILAIHGIKDTNSALAYRIRVINTALLALLRIPAAIYAATFLPMFKVSDPRFWLNLLSIFIYSRFLVRICLATSEKLQLIQLVSTRPAYFRVAQAANIPFYSMFLALASFMATVLSAVLYIQNSPRVLEPSQVWNLRAQLLITGFSAFLGARIPSVLFQHGPQGIFSLRIFTQNGLWIQGAVIAAILSIVIPNLVQRYRLFCAFALALPLGEALGRIGCYFAGCCGEKGKKSSRIPLQIQSALLNLLAGVAILTAYGNKAIEFERAAVISHATVATIRLYLRPNIFAMLQLLVATVTLATHSGLIKNTGGFERALPRTENHLQSSLSTNMFDSILLMFTGSYSILLAVASISAGWLLHVCDDAESKSSITEDMGTGDWSAI
ncbi:hypothetical protein BGZ60DRAFT_418393 [Tricladium varicosporioides]|nr:hypothetical protein BGZ60DRAFT_418393 [Hymenoscyphus varicosporioides]